MKSCFTATAILISLIGVLPVAQANPAPINLEFEQQNAQALLAYAQKTGKPAPQVVDYTYGMEMDVARLIYRSRSVLYCGTLQKILSFENPQGEPQSVRYLAQGECRNKQ